MLVLLLLFQYLLKILFGLFLVFVAVVLLWWFWLVSDERSYYVKDSEGNLAEVTLRHRARLYVGFQERFARDGNQCPQVLRDSPRKLQGLVLQWTQRRIFGSQGTPSELHDG